MKRLSRTSTLRSFLTANAIRAKNFFEYVTTWITARF